MKVTLPKRRQIPTVCLRLTAILLVAGCSPSQIRLEKQDLARLQGESKITVVTYGPAPLSIETRGDGFTTGMMAGAVGVFTGGLGGAVVGMYAESKAKAEGERWVQAYSLSDPAPEVRDGFISRLTVIFNLPSPDILPETLSNDDPKTPKERFGEVTILDFKTDTWRLTPGPMSASLRVVYGVRGRFLRTSDNRVLWQGYCSYDGKDSMATIEELKANSGALLKEKIENAATFCAKELVSQFWQSYY